MARKRKRSELKTTMPAPSKQAGVEQAGPFAPSIRQHPEAVSFLDLPSELQIEIYSLILAESGGLLTKDLRIAMPTSLSLVSKQIHTDLLSLAMYSFKVRVKDFQFARVITFLNRLPEGDIEMWKPKNKNNTTSRQLKRRPRLQIELVVTDCSVAIDEDRKKHLLRWLNRFNVPNKRASNLEIEYIWMSDQLGDFDWLRGWYSTRQTYIPNLSHEVGKAEMSKILGSALATWKKEYVEIVELLKHEDIVCKCPPGYVRGSCEHCKLSRKVMDFKPPGDEES